MNWRNRKRELDFFRMCITEPSSAHASYFQQVRNVSATASKLG